MHISGSNRRLEGMMFGIPFISSQLLNLEAF